MSGLAWQKAPLILVEEVKGPAVQVCDVLVCVDRLAKSVALYLDTEQEVGATRHDPANDALEVYEGLEFLVVDVGYSDGHADPVEAVLLVGPAQVGLGLVVGGPKEGLGLGDGLGVGGCECLGPPDEVPEGGVVYADAGVVGVGVGDLGHVVDGHDVRGQELGFCV